MREYTVKSIRIIWLGICAICAQSIFIRELHALFSGTEFVVGVLLASWMLWVGAGGLAGGRILKRISGENSQRLFEIFSIVAALLLPVTVLAIRYGRGSFEVPSGELPPFLPALVFSVFIFVPFGMIYGLIYNLASMMWGGGGGELKKGVSRAYIWDALGSLLGALIFSLILIPMLSQLEAAVLIGFGVIAAILTTSSRLSGKISLPLLAVSGIVLLLITPALDRESYQYIFDDYRLEDFHTSRYGEVVVAESGEMFSFFSGGERIFSVPEPERAEETVHIPMLLHPDPAEVLLIGGSLGGGWDEVVKHPQVRRVDCVELNGKLLRLALRVRDDLEGFEGGWVEEGSEYLLRDDQKVVRFIVGDGRFFLATRDESYDVIIMNAPVPLNLQWNRYYTEEFFMLVRKRLNRDGIFSFQHPSSENFISPLQAVILKSLELTLKEVFNHTLVLPGGVAHLVASQSVYTPGMIMNHIGDRGIKTTFINQNYLPYRFSGERMSYIRERLEEGGEARINTDDMPVLPLYEMSLEGKKRSYDFLIMLGSLVSLHSLWIPSVFAVVILIIYISVGRIIPARLSVWSVGFTSFMFQMLILLAHQSYSGHLYHSIIIISAVFMGGIAMGAAICGMVRQVTSGLIRRLHVLFIAVSLSLVFAMDVLIRSDVAYLWGTLLFLLYSTGFGAITGFYYRVVVRRALPADGSAAPARFYSWDLLGACMGGALGGILILPVAGLDLTAYLIAVIHLMAIFLLSSRW